MTIHRQIRMKKIESYKRSSLFYLLWKKFFCKIDYGWGKIFLQAGDVQQREDVGGKLKSTECQIPE